MRFIHTVAIAAITITSIPAPTSAGYIPAYGTLDLSSLQFNYVMNKIVMDGATRPRNSNKSTARSTIAQRQSTAVTNSTMKKLAANYPPAERAKAEKVFTDLLAGYAQIEQKFGIPKDDLAGALAAFLAGSYMAYHDVELPDAHFGALVDQMRRSLATEPRFAELGQAERRDAYEQLAIAGMMMAVTKMALKSEPDARVAADMRSSAKRNLDQVLGIGADKIEISEKGLTLSGV